MSKRATAMAAPPPAGGNIGAAKQAMWDKVAELGELEAKGGNARPTLAIECVQWAADGTADVGDAQDIYTRYYDRVEAISASFGGSKHTRNKDVGMKQNISKIRQFLKMGGLRTIDPVKVIHQAAAVTKEERAKGTILYSPFDCLLNIARRQCQQTQAELTREEMVEANRPKDRGDVSEADFLGSVDNKLEQAEDTWGSSDEVTSARDALAARIEALGGTTAQKKAKERAEKQAAKEADKKSKRKVKRL